MQSFKKRTDLLPNFNPHTGVASQNASIASSTTVSTLWDSLTDYFGLGKPAVVGEERFRSLTEPKWGEFEAADFGRLESSEKKLVLGWYALGASMSCRLYSRCRVPVPHSKTSNLDLDGFLIQWVRSMRDTSQHDASIQHPSCKLHLVLAGVASRYHPQTEKDTEVGPSICLGHRAYHGHRNGC